MSSIMDVDFFSPNIDDRQGVSSAREAFLSEEEGHHGSSFGGSFRAVEDVFGSNVIDMDVWGMESDHHPHNHRRFPNMEMTSPNKAHVAPIKGNIRGVFPSMNKSSVDPVAMSPFNAGGVDAFSNSRQQVHRTRPSERSKNRKRESRTNSGDNKKRISSPAGDRRRSRSRSADDGVGNPVVGEFILEVETIEDPFAHAGLKLKDPQAKPADQFRKKKSDALMSSIKSEQGRRRRRRHQRLPPSATEEGIEFKVPQDDEDHQGWMKLKEGNLEQDETTRSNSSPSKKNHGSCRGSPITTQSPRSTRIIYVERVPSRAKEKRHHSNSSSYLSKRLKERTTSDKHSSKDRRSSVHDSLSQFLESKNPLLADNGGGNGKAVLLPNKRRGSLANRSLASAPGLTREHTSKSRPSRRLSSNGGNPMFGEKSSGNGGSSRGSTRSDATTQTPRCPQPASSGPHQAASLAKYMVKHQPLQLMGKDFEDAVEYRSTSSAPAVSTARHNDMAGLARSCRKLKLAF